MLNMLEVVVLAVLRNAIRTVYHALDITTHRVWQLELTHSKLAGVVTRTQVTNVDRLALADRLVG